MSARRVGIGIDTRGTFTDVVAVDEETGQTATTKTPSTPADSAEGFLNGVRKVLGLMELDGSAVTAVSHGTTVATNHLEAHETAHSTAPGAPLQNGLDDQATTASTGARAPFSVRNGTPRQGPTGLQRHTRPATPAPPGPQRRDDTSPPLLLGTYQITSRHRPVNKWDAGARQRGRAEPPPVQSAAGMSL